MSEIKKYLRDYKFNSLFFRNLQHILMLIMIPIAGLCVAIFVFYNNWVSTEMRNHSDKITQEIKNEWEQIIGNCERDLFHIKTNDWVELFFYDKKMQQLSYTYSDIHNLISFPVLSEDHVRDIFLYTGNNGHILTRRYITQLENALEKPYVDAWYNQSEESKLLLYPEKIDTYPKNVLLLYSPSTYADQNGLCVMLLDSNVLSGLLTSQDPCTFYISDGRIILVSGDKNAIGQPERAIEALQTDAAPAPIDEKDGFLINRVALDDGNLELITMIREVDYFPQLGFLHYAVLAFCIAVFLLSILLAIHTSVKMYRPISEILYFLHTAENTGKLEAYEVKDEAEFILHSIKKQMYFSEDIEKELKERMQLLKKAQIVALQSQINPHFINNTLDTINWMAIRKLGENNEVSETLRVLADMLRILFRENDTLIPIKKEIEHCKNYLSIQKLRQPSHFQVIWNIPEKLQQCKTIPVVLQPIVENAVCHGIEQLTEDGCISITASLAPDAIIFEIEDNGLGMNEEEISSLRSHMQQAMTKENDHIGLSNVNQRLKLWFGEEYGVFLNSKKYFGTKVTVRIPNITGEG